MTLYLCLVTFVTAAVFTYINIFSNKRLGSYFFLIPAAIAVISFCVIYGIIGVLLFIFLKEGVLHIDVNSTSVSGPYLTAFVTGVATKGVADIKFFDINIQGQPFPIGLRSITLFLDNQYNKAFDAIGFSRYLAFITRFQQKYSHVDTILFKQHVVKMLAAHPSKEKVVAFTNSVINPADSIIEVLDGILKEFGRKTLEVIDQAMPGQLDININR